MFCQGRIWMAVTQAGSRGAAGCPGHTHLKHKHSLTDWWRLGPHAGWMCVRVCVCPQLLTHSSYRWSVAGFTRTRWDCVRPKWRFAISLFSISRKCDIHSFLSGFSPLLSFLLWVWVWVLKLPEFPAKFPSRWGLNLKSRPLQSGPTAERRLWFGAPQWKNPRPHSLLRLLTCFTRQPITCFIIQAWFPSSVCLRWDLLKERKKENPTNSHICEHLLTPRNDCASQTGANNTTSPTATCFVHRQNL